MNSSKHLWLGLSCLVACGDSVSSGAGGREQAADVGNSQDAGSAAQGSSLADGGAGSTGAMPPSCGAEACPAPGCEELGVAACKLDARCHVVSGWTYDPNNKCRGDEVELGCANAKACEPIATLATDALGRSYNFAESGSSCLPSSFSASGSGLYPLCSDGQVDACAGLTYQDCDTHPQCRDGLGCPVDATPTGPGECEQRSVADCKSDGKCASVAAQPLDAACNYDELVGCRTVNRTCHTQITFAKNAAGRVFQLWSDDCLPPGFTKADVPQPGAGVCPVSYANHCSALGVARCGEASGCELVVGDALDLTAHCIGKSIAFACAAKSETRYDGAAIAVTYSGERYRVNGHRYVPELTVYPASGAFYTAATAALLAWPACL